MDVTVTVNFALNIVERRVQLILHFWLI